MKIISNTQRLLKRLDRTLSGPIVEFSEQFLYGHREIIVTYADLHEKAMLLGSIEHGWALDSGKGIRKFTGGRFEYLSWSDQRMRRSDVENSKTIAFGAPFIYAYELVKDEIIEFGKTNPISSRGTLFFPVHGNEYSQQNAEKQIELFCEKYDPKESSVSLYWVEYVNPEIHNAYRKAGFKIYCSGFSGQMEHTGLGYSARKLAGSPIGGRPNFLLNTIGILSSHEKIVFGGLGTGLYYAAYMEKDIDLLFKYLDSEFLDMNYENGSSFRTDHDEVRYVAFLERQIGTQFSGIDFNSEKFRSLAKSELGLQHLMSPSTMNRLLRNKVSNIANPQSVRVFKKSVSQFQMLLRQFYEE